MTVVPPKRINTLAVPSVVLVVARGSNGVIGRDGDLPWRLRSDLQRFKADTMGKPILMGRKTWESFPRKPLPGRLNIVITRDRSYVAEGAETVGSLDAALAAGRAGMPGADELCVIGGGEIFTQAMPLADRLHVTHVLAEIDGDTLFPPILPSEWRILSAIDIPAGEKDSHATRYAVYERRGAEA